MTWWALQLGLRIGELADHPQAGNLCLNFSR